MRIRSLLSSSALFLIVSLSAVTYSAAQAPAPLPRGAADTEQASPQRATSTPYTGDLSIFETPGRDERLHINAVMDALSLSRGKTVADIGAGSGWFTVRAAKRVGNTGEVYAVDINPEAIDYIDNRVKKEHITNVKTVVSEPDNPKLPRNSVDAVLLLKTYHEVENPVALLRNLKPALRPGALIGIIDRDGNGTDHGLHKSIVLREASQAGYRLVAEHDNLVTDDKMDYFLVLGVK